MTKTVKVEIINNEFGVIIADEGETYVIREGKEMAWIDYMMSIKIKPGMVIPRFHEFFINY